MNAGINFINRPSILKGGKEAKKSEYIEEVSLQKLPNLLQRPGSSLLDFRDFLAKIWSAVCCCSSLAMARFGY